MTIEYSENGGQANKYSNLVSCPFCGKEFGKNAGMQRTQHLINCDEADRSVRYE